MKLRVSLLDKWYPKLFSIGALAEHELLVSCVARQSIIDKNISPLGILEEAEDVDAVRSELVENRRVNARTEHL